MRWEDERYVRLYTRDTPEWVFWPWQARATMPLLLRKADRMGCIDGVESFDNIGQFIGLPQEVAEAGVLAMLKSGALEHKNDCLIFRNFIEAQEATMSPNLRAAESRRRARDRIRSGLPSAAQRETCIYFLQSENGGPLKIGIADDVAKRIAGLQTARPDRLLLLAAVPGTPQMERELHNAFAWCRQKGEWFAPHESLLELASDAAQAGVLPDLSRYATGHKTLPVTPGLPVAVVVTPSVPSLPSSKTKDLVATPSASATAGAPSVPVPAEPPQQVAPVPAEQDPEIALLEAGWPAELLRRVKRALESTRTSGLMSQSKWRGFLKSAANFSRSVRVSAAETYIERAYASEGKDERYLIGIMRGENQPPTLPLGPRQQQTRDVPAPTAPGTAATQRYLDEQAALARQVAAEKAARDAKKAGGGQ